MTSKTVSQLQAAGSREMPGSLDTIKINMRESVYQLPVYEYGNKNFLNADSRGNKLHQVLLA